MNQRFKQRSGRRLGVRPLWLVFILLLVDASLQLARAAGLPDFVPLPSPQSSFLAPARIAADGQSRLLVSDPLAGKVVVLDASGQELSVKSGLSQPLGIAVAEDGKIYLGDATTGAVSVFDAQWNLLGQLGQGPGEFQLPGYVATLTEGGVTTVFVSDGLAHKVKAYRDGTLIGQFGSRGIGPNQFSFPAGIFVGTNGNLFVVDQSNDRVQVLDRNGNFLWRFTLQPSPTQINLSGRGQGIAGDSRGWLYVADTFQGYVKVFDVSGAFIGQVGGYGESPGQFRSPAGLVVDALDRLWVANANNGRMEGFVVLVSPPILLLNRSQSGDLILSWNVPNYVLQATTDLAGPWQTIYIASPFTIPAVAVAGTPQLYFRLRRQ